VTAQTWVALGASLIAATVAVVVPLVTFQTTLRVDRARWLRDERSKLYVDLIVEAVAEYEPYRVAVPKPERMDALFSPPRVRAELGARVSMLASDLVRAAWLRYDEEVSVHQPAESVTDDQRQAVQSALYERFAALEAAVRVEMTDM
jgi:hypothetical protein